MPGTAVLEVSGGRGGFARARGHVTSNFLLAELGELTDYHLGLLVLEGPGMKGGAMPLRLLILLSLACGVVAAVATAARGQQRSVIPSCEEVLTIDQAKDAMNEPDAAIIHREVTLHTRVCDYYGGKPHALPSHAVGVDWGPYRDLRRRSVSWAMANVCPVNKPACKALKLAMKTTSNTRSFALFGNALAKAGLVQRLHSGFGGNPAFLWRPHGGISPPDEFAWVEVYDTGSQYALQTLCTDKTDSSPDTSCAVTAAGHAFDNVGS